MRYGSVCSGIEAATVAWSNLPGWEPAFFSEIEAFPRAVLQHHYPNVPLHGDFTTIESGQYGAVDLLVGGTPCQDFSVAGLRAGLAGDRGRLTIEFCNLAGRLRPRWLVWENVPGVLSADDGNAFGIFIGALAKLGYGFAYRILDAQYFGTPQRRRRVFLVGHSGAAWQRAAAVLFEPESLSGHPAPSRRAGQTLAHAVTARTGDRWDHTQHDYITIGFSAGNSAEAYGIAASVETSPPLRAANSGTNQVPSVAIAFQQSQSGTRLSNTHATLDANGGGRYRGALIGESVRKLTPRESERLQGFPDDYTLIPYRGRLAADGPRQKALGNSMAVPVMRWIGERIQMVETLEAA